MDSTLARDLRALGLLYEWASQALGCDLDDTLEQCVIPKGRQLDAFISFLRSIPEREPANPSSLATLAIKAVAVRAFLSWAADPRNQGLSRSKSPQEIVDELGRLRAVFGPFTKHSGASERISPLDPSQVERVLSVIGPVRDSQGRCMVPLSFAATNPYRPHGQLRNWLMFAIALQCGLRRGELLKVRIDDIPKPNDPGLKVRRRPHDRSDTRRHRPRVKTSERVIPISAEISVGLRAYLSSPPPMGRHSGRTPYLFVSKEGHPLSIPAADEIPQIASHHANVPGFSWHSLRHTWAEGLADELLTECPEDQALAFIRELGGWKRNSDVPMHYIQDALAKRANEFLRERNARLYGTMETGIESVGVEPSM
jgi:integrase